MTYSLPVILGTDMDGNDVVADLAINNHILISGDPGTRKTDIAISVANQISKMFGNANKTMVVADASHVEMYNRRTYGGVVGDAREAFGSVEQAWYPNEMLHVRSHFEFSELRPIYILDNFNAVTDAFSRHDQRYGSTWRLATAVERSVRREAVEIAKIHTVLIGDISEDPHGRYTGDFSKYFRDAHVRIKTRENGLAECEYLDQTGNPVYVTMRVSPIKLSSPPWKPDCQLIRETD
jgi:hypothetical protein